MSSYREQLDAPGPHRKQRWRRWAKRQMSKFRRRIGKKMVALPPTAKLFRGWEL